MNRDQAQFLHRELGLLNYDIADYGYKAQDENHGT